MKGAFNSPESHTHYKRLHLAWLQGELAPRPAVVTGASLTVARVVADFLAWSRLHQPPATAETYAWHCEAFAGECGTIVAAELKPIRATRFVDARLAAGRWGAVTAYNCLRALFRAFSWATEQGLLDANPLARLKRHKPRGRKRALTDGEYRALLRHSSAAARRLLVALRLTGARPKELRGLTWDQVRGDRLVIAGHKTATTQGTRADRVIWLVGPVRKLLAWLKCTAQRSTKVAATSKCTALCSTNHVFLNTRGRPWTCSALVQVVEAARVRAGLADDVTAYLCRHAWGTAALVNGVNPATAALLMGNSVQVMVDVYSHLAEQTQFLAAEMERATRRPAG